ncbi:hypothetical protein TRFO_37024 [Tritrichomonas foetus]|uniref:Uncharacterized protein n=1 Tax=Tritrichomonas foetus TaxID=1144522 RepID=A0A1J4JC17_9EUKA|nr:hypothetical protein [Tritrichomonas foetus]OHS96746.1 hypothetical protein TRFO_37024 [Tritrichomonas foetus]|eukprot:OHS96746.1 hypothetical protein TRFO_37024 [Tritrichomonas foetus]
MIVAFDEELEALSDSIQKKQNQLKKLLTQKKRTEQRKTQLPKEETVEMLKEGIRALEDDIRNLSLSSTSESTGANYQMLNECDTVYAQCQQNYNDLNQEIQEIYDSYQECQDEYNKTNDTKKMFSAQLDQSIKTMQNYKKILNQLKATAADLNRNRQQLYKRGQDLAALITQLQLTKTNNEKEIRKLEEQYSDHQQLVVSYKMLEDRIKEQGKQQEVALNKMVDAVELTEEAAAESQKNRMTRDNYAEELKRIKDLITSSTKQFNIAFGEHEKSVRKQFDSALESIKERSAVLESDNSQLAHEKESLQRQLDTSSQENSILKAAKSDNGFSLFIERMSALKAEIEAAYGKKEQLTASNEKTQDNIDDIKAKLLTNATNTRNDTLELTQRAQKVEMELEMHKSTCKEIMEKNAKLIAENQKIRNEIIQVQRTTSNEAQNQLNDKDNELAEVKIQYEATQKANTKSITEMQQAVLAFKQHADKWKCKAQSIGLEASDAKQNAENQQQQLIDQINGLEGDLAERKQLKAKLDLMLQQMDQQIKSLKQQISNAEKKQRQQAANIQQTLTTKNSIVTDINKNKAVLDKLHVQVKREQRVMDSVNFVSNRRDSDFSDDII